MITAATLEAALHVLPDMLYRKLDRIVVKGRSQPAEIYELWDGTVDVEEAKRCRDLYEPALEAYFDGDWETALEGFKAAAFCEPARAYGPTTPSAVLIARCHDLLASGAKADWDGVYKMRTK